MWLQPVLPAFSQLLYARLFFDHPEMRRLFHNTDMSQLQRMLMATIHACVNSIDGLQFPDLQALADHHAALGVRSEHYDALGAALLWTLEQALGPNWNSDVRDAWAAFYGNIAGFVRRGLEASRHDREPPPDSETA
jgi:nitric oxide dioxygenase